MNILYFISCSEFLEYWDLVTQYVNVSSIFLWGFLGGLLGFILALVAVIVWRKKILVRRKYKVLKYFTYLYFAFIPLFTGFCFTQWFAFHSIEKQVVKHIPAMLGESNILFNKYVKEDLENLVGKERLNITGNQAVDIGLDVTGDVIKTMGMSGDSVTLEQAGTAFLASKVVKSDLMKGKAKTKATETIGEGLLVGSELAGELMNTEVSSILETGVVNIVVEKKVKGIFGGLKMQAFLMLLIGLGIPIAEILLAHYLERKRLRELNLLQDILPEDLL